MAEIIYYKDFDLSLAIHPFTGDLIRKVNQEAIKRSLRNLLSLNKWDIPFSPVSGVTNQSLFELPGNIAIISAKEDTRKLIEALEPRVTIQSINIFSSLTDNSIEIDLDYFIKSIEVNDLLKLTIQRVR